MLIIGGNFVKWIMLNANRQKKRDVIFFKCSNLSKVSDSECGYRRKFQWLELDVFVYSNLQERFMPQQYRCHLRGIS